MNKLIAHRLGPDSHPVLIDRMRELYNANIEMFTKPLHKLTCAEQAEWWAKLDHSTNIVHIYSPVEAPWQICAFSKVTDHGTHCSPLFAIGGAWWGKGYAKEIISHYLSLSPKPLRGEQLVSNKAICHLNEKFGWQIERTENGVDFLYHHNFPDRQQEIYDEIMRYHG